MANIGAVSILVKILILVIPIFHMPSQQQCSTLPEKKVILSSIDKPNGPVLGEGSGFVGADGGGGA